MASSRAVYGEGRNECPVHGAVYPGPRPEEQLQRGEWEHGCPSCDGPVSPGRTGESVMFPHNAYGLCKRDQDEIATRLGRRYRIPSVALRYSNASCLWSREGGMKGSLKEQIRRFMPRTVRPHRILSGRLRGYRIVASWHDYPGAILGRTERALLEWFERHVAPGETWVDVGAHYGYTAIALSRLVGAAGRVFAFEPVVATAGYAARTRAVNRLQQLVVIPCALGTPESLELNRLPPVRGMVDSTIRPNGDPLEAFLVTRLDWLWSRVCEGRRRVDGVKIDVQGMEIAAIMGMKALLREFTPKLVVEVHQGVDRRHLLDVLEGVGYARTAEVVEPASGETDPRYLDNRSYYFRRRV